MQKQNNNNNNNLSWTELRQSTESKCRLNITPTTRREIEPIVTTLVARSMAKVIDRQTNERQQHTNVSEQQQRLDSTNCHNRKTESKSKGCQEIVLPLVISQIGSTFDRTKRIGSIQHRQQPRTIFGKLINFTVTMMMMMVFAKKEYECSKTLKYSINKPYELFSQSRNIYYSIFLFHTFIFFSLSHFFIKKPSKL